MTQAQPREILESRGTYRKDRHAGRPLADGVRPLCPADLTGEARQIWKLTVSRFEAMRLLDSIDAVLLAEYSRRAAELGECRREWQRLKAQAKRLQKSEAKDRDRRLAAVNREVKQANVEYRGAADAFYKALDRLGGIGAVGRARVKAEGGIPSDDDDLDGGPKLAEDTIP